MIWMCCVHTFCTMSGNFYIFLSPPSVSSLFADHANGHCQKKFQAVRFFLPHYLIWLNLFLMFVLLSCGIGLIQIYDHIEKCPRWIRIRMLDKKIDIFINEIMNAPGIVVNKNTIPLWDLSQTAFLSGCLSNDLIAFWLNFYRPKNY